MYNDPRRSCCRIFVSQAKHASTNINEYPVPQKKDDYHSCLYFFRGFQWRKLLSQRPLAFSRNLDKANSNIPRYFNDLSIPRKLFNKISVAEAVSTYIKPQNYQCENKKARFLTFVFRNETNSTHTPKNHYSFSFGGLQPRAGSKAFLRASNHQVEEKQ